MLSILGYYMNIILLLPFFSFHFSLLLLIVLKHLFVSVLSVAWICVLFFLSLCFLLVLLWLFISCFVVDFFSVVHSNLFGLFHFFFYCLLLAYQSIFFLIKIKTWIEQMCNLLRMTKNKIIVITSYKPSVMTNQMECSIEFHIFKNKNEKFFFSFSSFQFNELKQNSRRTGHIEVAIFLKV